MCLEQSLKDPSIEETSAKSATDTLPQPSNTEAGSEDGDTEDHLARARQLLTEFPLIDGHNDFPYILRGWFANRVDSQSFSIDTLPIGQTDLSRLSRGHVGAQFWSAFVPCQTKADEFSTSTNIPSLLWTLQQIDLIHTLIKQHPRQLALAERADDVLPIFRSGRVASLIGVEGLHQIVNSASVLRMYHRLGVRYVTLCHDSNNRYADSATSATKPHGGISEAGKDMLREMNRIGMMIDLSHTSHATQRHALSISGAPVIFSHSSCHALNPHVRNVPDDVLDLLKANNGLIMICFLPSLVRKDGLKSASVGDVVDHIQYAGEKIGYAHVGIGSDFDGMLEGPEGLDDVRDYPGLVAELLRRNVAEEDVRKVCGGNLIRIMREVERFAVDKAGKERDILCDEVEEVWTKDQRDMIATRGAKRM